MPSSKIKNPVLVIGGFVTGLRVARLFAKHGIDVHLVTDRESDMALRSKYWKRKLIIPRPWDYQFLKRLLRQIAKTSTDRIVVYPTTDLDALALATIKDELKDDYYFVVGDREATETLVNKRKFYQSLSNTSIDYPATFFPKDLGSVKRIGKKIGYPVFIRPSITQILWYAFGKGGKGFVAKSYSELLDYYCLATSKKVETMFQEIIPGPPNNSFQIEGYFNRDFRPTGLFARQRLRIWPPDFGDTTLCVSIPLSKLSFECKQIVDFIGRIKYNGLVSAEFKRDSRDGRYKLLEINARTWLHFWLSAECGVDIVMSSYLDAIGEKAKYKQEYITGIKSIHLKNDFLASATMLRKGELAIFDWLSSLRGIRQSEVFDKDDMSPFFATYLTRFFPYKRALKRQRK